MTTRLPWLGVLRRERAHAAAIRARQDRSVPGPRRRRPSDRPGRRHRPPAIAGRVPRPPSPRPRARRRSGPGRHDHRAARAPSRDPIASNAAPRFSHETHLTSPAMSPTDSRANRACRAPLTSHFEPVGRYNGNVHKPARGFMVQSNRGREKEVITMIARLMVLGLMVVGGWPRAAAAETAADRDHAPGRFRRQGPGHLGNERPSRLGRVPGAPRLGRKDAQATPAASWDHSTAATTRLALRQRRKRLEAWRRERAPGAGPDDRIIPGLTMSWRGCPPRRA